MNNACPICGCESIQVIQFGLIQYLCLSFKCNAIWQYVDSRTRMAEQVDFIDVSIFDLDILDSFELDDLDDSDLGRLI